MDIRGILDRVVVILKLGELGRDAVLNIRDALIQPGDNPCNVCVSSTLARKAMISLNDSMALDASPETSVLTCCCKAVSAFLISVSS